MAILRFLEGIRTPFGDSFFSIITHLGEETVFILAGLLFFWCINKKQGYYLLAVGFLGTVINQFLKLWFRIPRPWVRDPKFTIVESARAEATGYSFPSGHTQSAVGVFGGIARIASGKWVRAVCLAICILVPFSRMYLGVHTPADVGVSLLVAVVLILGLHPLVDWALKEKKHMRIFLGAMTLFAVAFLLFGHLYEFPPEMDESNLLHGIKNAYKILGCILGLWLAYEVDEGYTHFDTKAVWWAQILKLVLGLIPILAIKSGLKAPLNALFEGSFLADGVRYFLLTAFAGAIWPMTFRFFGRFKK